jgi:hypothetical protein
MCCRFRFPFAAIGGSGGIDRSVPECICLIRPFSIEDEGVPGTVIMEQFDYAY